MQANWFRFSTEESGVYFFVSPIYIDGGKKTVNPGWLRDENREARRSLPIVNELWYTHCFDVIRGHDNLQRWARLAESAGCSLRQTKHFTPSMESNPLWC